jgi:C-terminal peptidase prc
MKKILFLTVLFIFLPFLSVQAFTVKIVDDRFIDRYLGSIISEDNVFESKVWYLEPNNKERYLLSDVDQLTKILNKFAKKTNYTTLKKIPTTLDQKSIDYNVAKKYRGQFLFDANKKDEIWYVNPLDLLRYKISSDETGLKTLNDLALSLSLEKISILNIAGESATENTEAKIDFNKYNEIRSILEQNYYKPEKINNQELFYGSLTGLVGSLGDPYTQFFTPTKKTQFDNSIEGSVEGIGAMVDLKNNILTVITPLNDSPAMKAGLKSNDQILEVDGVSIRNFSLEKSISLIKGQKGTTVTLKIYRQAEEKTFEIKIIRDKIIIPNVIAKKLDNNLVYFSISTFSPNMISDFNKLRQQYTDDSTKGIIIDLRNNPGGYTDSAIALADIWLPANVLMLQEKFRSNTENYYTRTVENLKIPTIILINNGTASAAEIFSLALREANSAKLVGETSYGKGTGQMVEQFVDGSALKYTYFEWLTGLGNSIETRGMQPDFEVKNNSTTNIDAQLNKAIELLK